MSGSNNSVGLLRASLSDGWLFTARPIEVGCVWVLHVGHPTSAQVAAEGIMYSLHRGSRLLDCFDGRIVVLCKRGDRIDINADGSGSRRSATGDLLKKLQSDGTQYEYKPHNYSRSTAGRVVVFDVDDSSLCM